MAPTSTNPNGPGRTTIEHPPYNAASAVYYGNEEVHSRPRTYSTVCQPSLSAISIQVDAIPHLLGPI
jgi:hypothetical protein